MESTVCQGIITIRNVPGYMSVAAAAVDSRSMRGERHALAVDPWNELR